MGAILAVVGCGGGASVSDVTEGPITPEEPLSTLSQDLKESIAHMYNEEGLAYDVYLNVYNELNARDGIKVSQLYNIATNSEIKHIEEVNTLAIKYDLNITDYPDLPAPYSVEGIGDGNYSVEAINILYDTLYTKGIQSTQDALEMGCMVEVVDIDDLDKYIALAEESNASDVLDVFNILINGSYKHYWTFNDALVGMGVGEGCCQMAKDLGHETCPAYPRN